MAKAFTQNILDTLTVKIDTNLASKQYFLVNFETDESVVNLATDATKIPFVLQDDGDGSSTAKTGSIITAGRVLVKVGGSVNAGDSCTSNGSGQGIAASSAGQKCAGVFLQGGASGDLVPMLIAPHVYYTA